MPRLRAAYTLIPKQLSTNPTNLSERKLNVTQIRTHYSHRKKATREMLRSSSGVLEDAKIDLKTAGVTGLRFFSSGGGATGRGVDGA